jgi:hypothetical protein
MAGSSLKLWVGLGSYVLVGATAAAADPGDHGSAAKPAWEQVAQAAHQHGAGGEGGEGGEGGADPLAGLGEDQAYLANVAMIRGHLDVGRELYGAGRTGDALPHFVHPVEEIYPGIKAELEEHGVAPFLADLERLAALAKAKAPAKEVEAQLGTVGAALDRAVAFVPAEARRDPAFAMPVVVGLLRTAADEYGEAVEGKRVVNVAEYQDSLGFVREARRWVEGMAPALGAKDKQAAADLSKGLDALGKAYPSVQPPKQAAMEKGAYEAAVSRVELTASRLK